MDEQDYEEERGVGQPADKSALPTGDSYTSQPERNLQPGDPNLVGGAPPAEKKGMAEKVKGLFGGMKKGHHEDTHSAVGSGVGHTPESSPYGTGSGDEYTGRSLDPTGAPGRDGEFRDEDASDEGVPHPTNPQGVTNEQGGAALTDEHGNLKPGPHQNAVKREGVLSKIKDKLHGSK
jgi:hypothetical protein